MMRMRSSGWHGAAVRTALVAAAIGIVCRFLPAQTAAPAGAVGGTGAVAGGAAPPSSSFPGDGKGGFATGKYRNLFVEILGKTEAESHARVMRAYNALYHGDLQKE